MYPWVPFVVSQKKLPKIGLGRRLTITGNSLQERYSEMVGETDQVCVIEVDRDRRRLILSERAASSETRDSIKERY